MLFEPRETPGDDEVAPGHDEGEAMRRTESPTLNPPPIIWKMKIGRSERIYNNNMRRKITVSVIT